MEIKKSLKRSFAVICEAAIWHIIKNAFINIAENQFIG
jgi:hypothetical protein